MPYSFSHYKIISLKKDLQFWANWQWSEWVECKNLCLHADLFTFSSERDWKSSTILNSTFVDSSFTVKDIFITSLSLGEVVPLSSGFFFWMNWLELSRAIRRALIARGVNFDNLFFCFSLKWDVFLSPFRPPTGSIFLYNRKRVKFRHDGFVWKKRKEGKSTREDHMKLKVKGEEVCLVIVTNGKSWPSFSWVIRERCQPFWFGQNCCDCCTCYNVLLNAHEF